MNPNMQKLEKALLEELEDIVIKGHQYLTGEQREKAIQQHVENILKKLEGEVVETKTK